MEQEITIEELREIADIAERADAAAAQLRAPVVE